MTEKNLDTLRSILAAIGTLLVAFGVLNDNEVSVLVDQIMMTVGSIMTVYAILSPHFKKE